MLLIMPQPTTAVFILFKVVSSFSFPARCKFIFSHSRLRVYRHSESGFGAGRPAFSGFDSVVQSGWSFRLTHCFLNENRFLVLRLYLKFTGKAPFRQWIRHILIHILPSLQLKAWPDLICCFCRRILPRWSGTKP